MASEVVTVTVETLESFDSSMYLLARLDRVFTQEVSLCSSNAKTVMDFQTKSQFIAFSCIYDLNSICHLIKCLSARYIGQGK